MGFGLGFVLGGVRQGQEDRRRQERDDFALSQLQKQAERADVAFAQQQEDRAFGLPYARKQIERQSESGDLDLEIKRNEAEIAKILNTPGMAKDQAMQKVKEIELKNDGLVYKIYNLQGGKAAARALNDLRSNDVQNAADIIEAKDPKTGKVMLKVVDANGQVVSDSRRGPAVFQKDALEAAFNPATKGRYSMEDGVVLDTASGSVRGIPGYANPKDKNASDKATMDKLKLAIDKVLMPRYGGRFEGGFWFPDDKNRDIATNAQSILETKIAAGMEPVRAAEEAAREAESGMLPPHRWTREKLPDGSEGINDGKGLRRPTPDEAKRLGLNGNATSALKDFYVKKTAGGNEVNITRQQIEETAKNRGMTPQQVIEKLGLQ